MRGRHSAHTVAKGLQVFRCRATPGGLLDVPRAAGMMKELLVQTRHKRRHKRHGLGSLGTEPSRVHTIAMLATARFRKEHLEQKRPEGGLSPGVETLTGLQSRWPVKVKVFAAFCVVPSADGCIMIYIADASTVFARALLQHCI